MLDQCSVAHIDGHYSLQICKLSRSSSLSLVSSGRSVVPLIKMQNNGGEGKPSKKGKKEATAAP